MGGSHPAEKPGGLKRELLQTALLLVVDARRFSGVGGFGFGDAVSGDLVVDCQSSGGARWACSSVRVAFRLEHRGDIMPPLNHRRMS